MDKRFYTLQEKADLLTIELAYGHYLPDFFMPIDSQVFSWVRNAAKRGGDATTVVAAIAEASEHWGPFRDSAHAGRTISTLLRTVTFNRKAPQFNLNQVAPVVHPAPVEEVVEQWKAIEGFPAYEVSDLGRVRRIPGKGSPKGRILKQNPDRNGYLKVTIDIAGKKPALRIHRLVAEAFIPNPKNLPHVNHKGGKTDNRAIALEWRSVAGHAQDVVRRNQKGEGICFVKARNKWQAYYSPEPKKPQVNLGTFATRKEALAARRKAIDAMPYLEIKKPRFKDVARRSLKKKIA